MENNGFDSVTMPHRQPSGSQGGQTDNGFSEVTESGPSSDSKQKTGMFMNRYRVIKELGRGGMGMVYHCFDEVGKIEVALKTLPPELSHNAAEMEDIRDNFQIVHKLNHSNIAAVHQIEKDPVSGDCYIIMEYVNGMELRSWMRERRKDGDAIPIAETLPILRQIATALDFAHAKNVIHRDIKPANIMLTMDNEVKLLDFGLAAQLHSSMSNVSMAVTGRAGTAAYMSPEQMSGSRQKATADQYALAVVAYEMLAGRRPFDCPDFEMLKSAVLNNDPEPVEGIPNYAWKALKKALARKPEDRFASCMDFVDALEGKKPLPHGKAQMGNRSVLIGGAVLAAAILALWGASVLMKPEKPIAPPKTPISVTPPAEPGTGGVSEIPFSGTITLPGNVQLEMVKIQAGRFQMGSPELEEERESDEIQHWVTLTKDFWLGKYEVTQEQYEAVMGTNPSHFKKGGRYPVEKVSWNDAMAFCKKLNSRLSGKLPTGYEFSLPTEAQWEYACRAGTTTPYSFGNQLNGTEANCDGDNPYGTSQKGPYLGKTSPVGSYSKNAWGLYDMHGNVWEWCRDWYESYPSGNMIDPVGPASGSARVRRGGSWYLNAGYCRAAYRCSITSVISFNFLGFRLALVPVQ